MDSNRYQATQFGEPRSTGGKYGYVAYFPNEIPRSIDLSPRVIRMLSEADASLGKLAGVGQLVPNPHLLIRPYVLREAIASTRIEGTQASMSELFELDAMGGEPNEDLEEVIAYMDALEWGLRKLSKLPLSSRLMREMHGRLLAGVRGRERTPGEFRTSQNWIGGPATTIEKALFVPPPPEELPGLLSDWEKFAHEQSELPLLIQNALLHYQLETLHPFLDGNGRLGRLLVVFFLVERDRLSAPLLYVSSYLERERSSYYDALQAVRERGDPEPWFELFLVAVHTQAADAVKRAERIVELRETFRTAASSIRSTNVNGMIDLICFTPIVTARLVEERLSVTRPTALTLMDRFEGAGVLEAIEAGARGQRRYIARELYEVVTDAEASEAK